MGTDNPGFLAKRTSSQVQKSQPLEVTDSRAWSLEPRAQNLGEAPKRAGFRPLEIALLFIWVETAILLFKLILLKFESPAIEF